MNKQKRNRLLKVTAFSALLPLLCAWVDPVDINADTEGSAVAEACADGALPFNNAEACNMVALSDGTKLDRCDTPLSAYDINGGRNPPAACHRWNLVWGAVSSGGALTKQDDWQPNLNETGWRLPTIKELTRLINFGITDANTLIESPTIKNWFTSDSFWSDENKTAFGEGTKTVWLISSTYRDIDGSDPETATGNAQIFAINIINGEIKTFEPGLKTATDEEGAAFDGGSGLGLCISLTNTGACSGYGSIAKNIVYALKVRAESVTKLQQ